MKNAIIHIEVLPPCSKTTFCSRCESSDMDKHTYAYANVFIRGPTPSQGGVRQGFGSFLPLSYPRPPPSSSVSEATSAWHLRQSLHCELFGCPFPSPVETGRLPWSLSAACPPVSAHAATINCGSLLALTLADASLHSFDWIPVTISRARVK